MNKWDEFRGMHTPSPFKHLLMTSGTGKHFTYKKMHTLSHDHMLLKPLVIAAGMVDCHEYHDLDTSVSLHAQELLQPLPSQIPAILDGYIVKG